MINILKNLQVGELFLMETGIYKIFLNIYDF